MAIEPKVIINLRVKPDVRDDFMIAAELRGASMSGLIHQFIVKTIREEKEREPAAFATEAISHRATVERVSDAPIPEAMKHIRNGGDVQSRPRGEKARIKR